MLKLTHQPRYKNQVLLLVFSLVQSSLFAPVPVKIHQLKIPQLKIPFQTLNHLYTIRVIFPMFIVYFYKCFNRY